MAVYDFVAAVLDTSPVLEMARGDIGTVSDIQARSATHWLTLVVPAVGDVLLGVNYGNQGTSLTGTLVTGGGGPTYFAF